MGIRNPLSVPPLSLFTDKVLSVSGQVGDSDTSEETDVSLLSSLYVFVKNTGTSTNCTVFIKGKLATGSDMTSNLGVFDLGAGSIESPYSEGRYIEEWPDIVYAEICNYDLSKQAKITVTLSRRR